MIQDYQRRKWSSAQNEYENVSRLEKEKFSSEKPLNHSASFKETVNYYLKYTRLFNEFLSCYELIIHPQKRVILKSLTETSAVRLLELKAHLIKLECSEFPIVDISDYILTDNKVFSDYEITIPSYYLQENQVHLEERSLYFKNNSKITEYNKEDFEPMNIEEAVLLIQNHERARQAKKKITYLIDHGFGENNKKINFHDFTETPKLTKDQAVTIISKFWRGYKARKNYEKFRKQEYIWLGMESKEQRDYSKTSKVQLELLKIRSKRQAIQNIYDFDYKQDIREIRNRLYEENAKEIRDKIVHRTREWFFKTHEQNGKFLPIPSVKDGGTLAIFNPELIPKKPEKKLKSTKQDKKVAIQNPAKNKKAKKAENFSFAKSKVIKFIEKNIDNYNSDWKNIDESWNVLQKHDPRPIENSSMKDVEREIRLQVDEMLRDELKNLRIAVDRQKPGKNRKKKGKAKVKKKKKNPKDLTPNRTVESLYDELVQQGFIIKVQEFDLNEFVGEHNFAGSLLRELNFEPMPSLANIKQAIIETCVLPLGSQFVHDNIQASKSLALVGPKSSCKRTLIHGICHTVGANLFNLSRDCLSERIGGKDDIKMLIHQIMKISKKIQPAVIMIENCEALFLKKKSSKDPMINVQKSLVKKLIKRIKKSDRIMILATSDSIHLTKPKIFSKVFKRIFAFPKPDYHSRFVIWRKLLYNESQSIVQHLDLNSLTYLSNGFTIGQILKACETVLTDSRVESALGGDNLTNREFIQALSTNDPFLEKDEKSIKQWLEKTTLGRKRKKLLKKLKNSNPSKTAKSRTSNAKKIK